MQLMIYQKADFTCVYILAPAHSLFAPTSSFLRSKYHWFVQTGFDIVSQTIAVVAYIELLAFHC